MLINSNTQIFYQIKSNHLFCNQTNKQTTNHFKITITE